MIGRRGRVVRGDQALRILGHRSDVIEEALTMGMSKRYPWARLALVFMSAAAVLLAGTPAYAQMGADGSTRPGRGGTAAPGARPEALSHARLALAGQPGVSAESINCWRNVTIFTLANLRLVSAELEYSDGSYGMLRARATRIAAWERFIVCRDSSTGWTVLASQANEKYVSVEMGYTGHSYGMLRARADIAGPWQLYRTSSPPNGLITSLYANANGHYVSAETSYPGGSYGMLRARAAEVGASENYYWYGEAWAGS